MLLGMAIPRVAGVFLGLFPTVFLKLFDPLTQQLTGQQISGQLGAVNGLVLSTATTIGGTVSTLGITLSAVCLLPVPLVLRLEDSHRPDLGLRPSRSDAADGTHRNGFLQTDPGLDPGSAFGGMGSSREMTISAIAEPAMMLVVQRLMIGQRMLLANIRLFAVQSVFPAGIAGVIAFVHNAGHIYIVAAVMILGILVYRIRESFCSMDTRKLSQLKG